MWAPLLGLAVLCAVAALVLIYRRKVRGRGLGLGFSKAEG